MKKSFLLITLIVNFIYFFNQKSYAGIKKLDEIIQWKKIDKENFIDTKEFFLSSNILELKVKTTGYNKLSLNIDCDNLTYKKKYEDKETLSQPILQKSTEYELASQLCFLTGLGGFYKDRSPKPFAKIIIKRFEENPRKYIRVTSNLNVEDMSNNFENDPQNKLKKNMTFIENNY
tara:strand:- start:6147 stop:6671 length:525 start_codon:yes stop_codon:yes gene_type:complete